MGFSSPLPLPFPSLLPSKPDSRIYFSFSGFVSVLCLLAAGRVSPSPVLGLEGGRRIASLLLEQSVALSQQKLMV